jgi:hypothetical protein
MGFGDGSGSVGSRDVDAKNGGIGSAFEGGEGGGLCEAVCVGIIAPGNLHGRGLGEGDGGEA